jgi:nucleoside-diphosphate-sugar epimerase
MNKRSSEKHILVTGGAGYVGSVTCEVLLSAGYRVRVLDSLMYGGTPLLGLVRPGFSFVNGDIREAEVVDHTLEDIDTVVHLAAIVGDPACSRQPKLAKEINQSATIQMFRLARNKGVKQIVFASTCSNYGKMNDSNFYVDEDSMLAPISLYAETKVIVEKELLSASKDDSPAVTVLRFATVFGLSPRMRFDLIVNEFTMELMTKRSLIVYGEQFWRPYVHVRDIARAIALVLDSPSEKVAGKVFNVGNTAQNYQKKSIVELIRTQIPGDLKIQSVHKEEDPRDYRVSFERIHRVLGFDITMTVEDGIREIVNAIFQGMFSKLDEPEYRN